MAYDNNGRITGNVSIEDVQKALGEYSKNDVRRLCSSDAINKWAKYKPVRFNGIVSPTDNERIDLEDPTTDISYDGPWPHGLEYPHSLDGENFGELAQEIIDGWSNADNKATYDGWIYRQPRGNFNARIKEYFRLHDFVNNENTSIGYNHNAGVPCKVYLKGASAFHQVTDSGKTYLDINYMATSSLTFGIEFENISSNEVSLGDVLAKFDSDSFYLHVEVFEEGTPWYNDGGTVVMDEAIADITHTTYTSIETTVSLDDFPNLKPRTDEIKYLHFVVGLVCMSRSVEYRIILPQSEKYISSTPPVYWDFHYPVKMSNHMSSYRSLKPIELTLKTTAPATYIFNASNDWTANYDGNRQNPFIQFQVNKYDTGDINNDLLYFIDPLFDVRQLPGGRPLYIEAVFEYNGIPVRSHWLTPRKSTDQGNVDLDTNCKIPQGPSDQWVTLYGRPMDNTGIDGLCPARNDVNNSSFIIRFRMYIGNINYTIRENDKITMKYDTPNS